MGLNPALEALTVPEGTEFPPTVQALLDLIASYESITGLESFSGVNFGPTEPDEDNRDKPWFKTDDSGNPIGWFSWTGSEWTTIPVTPESGGTSDRPSNPLTGQLYFDTDINVMLVYERSQWRTLSGSPGDIKEVKASTIEDALTANPGWAQDTASEGMVIAAASDGSASGSGDLIGAATVMISINNLPSDAVSLKSGWGPYSGAFQNGPQPAGVFPIVTGSGSTDETGPINPNAQSGLSVYQPTIYYFRIYKL